MSFFAVLESERECTSSFTRDGQASVTFSGHISCCTKSDLYQYDTGMALAKAQRATGPEKCFPGN